jgi:prolyl-tRNA editing enzyme YbaK/EbsC (Cys-tRNA(Pro) deacylase)
MSGGVLDSASVGRAPRRIFSGANRVDTEGLSAILGEPVAKADAPFVRRHTRFAIGGVAPVGHTGEVRKFVDRSRAAHQVIWAAAVAVDVAATIQLT